MGSNVPCIEVSRAFLTLDTVLASTACFTVTVLAVGLWTHYHGPVPVAATILRWNNQVYAAVSVVMLVLIVQFSAVSYNQHRYMVAAATAENKIAATLGPPAFMSDPSPTESTSGRGKQTVLVALAPLVYHFSKFYEYLDIILFLANHGPNYSSLSQQPVGLHFGFHHLTTPYLTWFRIIQCSYPGWEVFAGLNCLHHAILYLFLGGGLKIVGLKPEMLRKVLPWTGSLQLVIGIGMEAKALMVAPNNIVVAASRDTTGGHWIALGLLSTYLVLYMRDLRQRAEDKTSVAHKKLD